MIHQKISLEITKNEKLHQYILPPDSALGDCFDVLTQLRQYVFEKMQEEMNKETPQPLSPPQE